MAKINSKKKVGKDGLTKYQRYYKKNEEKIKAKNRERERERRQRIREEREAAPAIPNQAAPATSNPSTGTAHTSASLTTARTPPRMITTRDPGYNKAPPGTPSVPPDFRWEWIFPNQMWVQSMEKLAGDVGKNEVDKSTVRELDDMFAIREGIVNWGTAFGGVSNWDVSLDRSFRRAVDGNYVDLWKKQLWEHSQRGRKLLARLRTMDGTLPKEEWQVKQLWEHRVEFTEILVQGLTTLLLKTNILPSLTMVENTFDVGLDVTITLDDDDREESVNKDSQLAEEESAVETDSEGYLARYDGADYLIDLGGEWPVDVGDAKDATDSDDDGSWDGTHPTVDDEGDSGSDADAEGDSGSDADAEGDIDDEA
ncbi:hypothetical protein H0H93_012948 [Arthromyces matolae]|nr:hypothetical protein H0H93_012948 [Arthromyces matolae]